MSTKENKDFILQISSEYNIDPKLKWKRASKRKEGDGNVRVFINDKNSIQITIFENKDGDLTLHELDMGIENVSNLSDKVGSYKELCSFLFADLVLMNVLDHLKYYAKDFKEEFPKFVETANQIWKTTGANVMHISESDILEFLQSKDTHFFESFIIEEPPEKEFQYDFSSYLFRQKNFEESDFFQPMLSENLGVQYDMENFYPYLCKDEKSGICFLKIVAGGDWETPVTLYLYLDKENNKMEGFFDFGNDNMYDVKNKEAYGNNESDDDDILLKEEEKRDYIQEHEGEIDKKMQKKFISEIGKRLTTNKRPTFKR